MRCDSGNVLRLSRSEIAAIDFRRLLSRFQACVHLKIDKVEVIDLIVFEEGIVDKL
jgi:hypothetical protein